MIHLGRRSQISHVEAVKPTFDILDSAHDYFQLPLKTQLLTLVELWHTRCLYHKRQHRERT